MKTKNITLVGLLAIIVIVTVFVILLLPVLYNLVNDSKKELGSHVDRHDNIGQGLTGSAFFERLMKDSRFDNMPLILETPDESKWAEEIAWLRSVE